MKLQIKKKTSTKYPEKTHYIVAKSRKEVRNQSVNETLIEILSSINFQLETGQFKAEDLSPNTLVWIEKIINQLGKLRFNTANIVGIIDRHIGADDED